MRDHSEIVAGRPAEQKQLIHVSQTAAHKTLSALESPFAIFEVTDREGKGEVELLMRSKLEYPLLSVHVGNMYLHAFPKSFYGPLKTLQSFSCTLYHILSVLFIHQELLPFLCYGMQPNEVIKC
jgi:hypothetical protein